MMPATRGSQTSFARWDTRRCISRITGGHRDRPEADVAVIPSAAARVVGSCSGCRSWGSLSPANGQLRAEGRRLLAPLADEVSARLGFLVWHHRLIHGLATQESLTGAD